MSAVINLNGNNYKVLQLNKPSKYFTINWKMTLWCNYKCSYCFQKREKQTDIESIYKTSVKINRLIDILDENVCLQLVGGEVTYYDLEYIFNNYLTSSKIKKVTIITNFSRDVNYFNRLANLFKKRDIVINIVISCHLEYIKDFNTFYEKIKNLDNYIKLSHISIVVTNENYLTINKLFSTLNKENYSYFFSKLQLVKNQKGITEEVNHIYSKLVDTYVKDKKQWHLVFTDNTEMDFNRSELLKYNLNFRDYICYSNVRIDVDGKVRCGTCGLNRYKYMQLDSFIKLSKFEISKFLKNKCIRDSCPLCGFRMITLS